MHSHKLAARLKAAPRSLGVRLYHSTQATGFVLLSLIITDGESLHRQLGYALLALWLARVSWGLYTHSEDRLARYVSRQRLPLLILLLMMALTGITGWLQTTDAFWGEAWMMLTHEWLSNSLWLIVGLHVLQQWRNARRLPINPIRRMFRG